MNKRLLYLMLFFLLWLNKTPAHAQQSGVISPISGETISGVVIVKGTAADPNFSRYELSYLREEFASLGWIVFASGDQQVFDNTLTIWDTTTGQKENATVYPDGVYQIRLRSIRKDLTYEDFPPTKVIINNNTTFIATESPIPTVELPPSTIAPSPTPGQPTIAPEGITETITIATATPQIQVIDATSTAVVPTTIPVTATAEFIPLPPTQPAVLPSLTPFPAPTSIATLAPKATTVNQSFPTLATGEEETSPTSNNGAEAIINGFLQFDYGALGRGFRQGFLWAFGAFALFGVWLALRGVFRWIWQIIFSNW